MELGQRIRQARLEAGLSQRQLCGDTITRNMLSLIESGKARPGMDTLLVLAQRLGKSAAYFLEQDAVCSPNQSSMDSARKAYTQADYDRVLQILEGFCLPDDVFQGEMYLLRALSLIALARQALDQGRRPYAKTLLDKAAQAGGQTPYYTPETEGRRLLLAALAAPEDAAQNVAAMPGLEQELLLRGQVAFSQGQFHRCIKLLDAVEKPSDRWYLLRGAAALELGQPKEAAQFLHKAESALPQLCAPLLERCYRELEDYKTAYAYAVKQRKD